MSRGLVPDTDMAVNNLDFEGFGFECLPVDLTADRTDSSNNSKNTTA